MTLEEMKLKVYTVIEEYNEAEDNYTEDEDLAAKMNSCINMIMNEMSRFKKINAYTTLSVKEGDNLEFKDIDPNMYQLNLIRGVDYHTIQDRVIFNKTGTAEIYYYKYPTQITEETEDDYTFELDTDALEIMPYGVAGLLLASDISNNYGQIYTNLYKEKISQLDSRKAMGNVVFNGGINI